MSDRKFDEVVSNHLIGRLLSDAATFKKRGLANELLAQFFRGFSIEKLQALLRHPDTEVVKAAIWIASELPTQASFLLKDAIRLSHHPDRYIRHFALDVIALGTANTNHGDFAYVVERLDDPDQAVADAALFLICRATEAQLKAALHRLEAGLPDSRHVIGLRFLTEARSTNPIDVETMLDSADPLRRRYGLAVAERIYDKHPYLVRSAISNPDRFIFSAATHLLRLHEIRRHRSD